MLNITIMSKPMKWRQQVRDTKIQDVVQIYDTLVLRAAIVKALTFNYLAVA